MLWGTLALNSALIYYGSLSLWAKFCSSRTNENMTMCSQTCQSVHLISCQYFRLYGSTEYALEKKSSDRKHYQTTIIYYSNSRSMERLVCSGNTVIWSECVSTLSHTHMQFRAARSRCTNFSLARYSIPFAICRHIGSSLRCAVLICRKIFMYHSIYVHNVFDYTMDRE